MRGHDAEPPPKQRQEKLHTLMSTSPALLPFSYNHISFLIIPSFTPSLTMLSRPQWLLKLSARLPPQLRFLPWPAVRIIVSLIFVNIIIWAAVAVILKSHPSLTTPALLSYTLGLRHALDADHISAIDLMTRRLVAGGSKPVTVGTWFSLGHSTIVVITCIVVAATSGALESKFEGFRNIGGIIGTSVSAAVLILLGIGNAWILYKLVQRMRVVLRDDIRGGFEDGMGLDLEGGGILVRLFKRVFRFIDRPCKSDALGSKISYFRWSYE